MCTLSVLLLAILSLSCIPSQVFGGEEGEYQKEFEEILAKCGKEHDLSPDTYKADFEAEAPQKVKCFMACLMTEKNIMTKDGTIDLEAGKAVMERAFGDQPDKLETFVKALEKCSLEAKPKEDKCETAFQFMKCKRAEIHK